MTGDQALDIDRKIAINHVPSETIRRADAVVGLPVRLAGFGVRFNVAINQLPVNQSPSIDSFSQHAPHAGHLLVAAK